MTRIIYIANARIPTEKAHGIQIMKTCEAFGLFDADVELILPKRKNPKFVSLNPFDIYRIDNKFKLIKIFSLDPRWLIKFPGSLYIKIQSILFCIGLWCYFRKNKLDVSDIIYTRDELLLPFLSRFSNKVVWEAHTLPRNFKFYLKSWHRCHKIISISNGLKDDLVELGLKEENILVAPDGVDLDAFQKIPDDKEMLRRKLNLPLNKKIIMYVGHLYDWKGPEVLAEAAKNFSGDELFVFVGGTDKEVELFNDKFSRNKNILIIGHIEHELVPFYLKSADVLILPNSAKKKISRVYTSPMKLFEYMAVGRPIVASNLPSIREILNEDLAVLVKPDSPQALEQGIKKIIRDNKLSHEISLRLIEKSKSYTWAKRAKSIIEFIS